MHWFKKNVFAVSRSRYLLPLDSLQYIVFFELTHVIDVLITLILSKEHCNHIESLFLLNSRSMLGGALYEKTQQNSKENLPDDL